MVRTRGTAQGNADGAHDGTSWTDQVPALWVIYGAPHRGGQTRPSSAATPVLVPTAFQAPNPQVLPECHPKPKSYLAHGDQHPSTGRHGCA